MSVQSSFRMCCKQPNFNLYIWESKNLHIQYPRGQDRVIQRAIQSHHPCRATYMEMFHSKWYNVIPDNDVEHRPDGARPFIDLWYRELLPPVQVTDAKNKGIQKTLSCSHPCTNFTISNTRQQMHTYMIKSPLY